MPYAGNDESRGLKPILRAFLVAAVLMGTVTASALRARAEPHVVVQVSGRGDGQVAPFEVADDWELRWKFLGDIDNALFQIFINKTNSVEPDLPIDGITRAGSGEGRERQARGGRYYLKIIA